MSVEKNPNISLLYFGRTSMLESKRSKISSSGMFPVPKLSLVKLHNDFISCLFNSLVDL